MRIALLSAIAVLLAAPAWAADAPKPSDNGPKSPAAAPAEPAAEPAAPADVLADEAFGPLTLGMKAAAVVKALGAPASKGTAVLQEVDGMWVQTWRYPKQGIELMMDSGTKGGAQALAAIDAAAPCALKTKKGIGIGSEEKAVRAAYGAVEDEEAHRQPDLFVAGSIYGGIFFRFEKGRVVSIFVGAGAE